MNRLKVNALQGAIMRVRDHVNAHARRWMRTPTMCPAGLRNLNDTDFSASVMDCMASMYFTNADRHDSAKYLAAGSMETAVALSDRSRLRPLVSSKCLHETLHVFACVMSCTLRHVGDVLSSYGCNLCCATWLVSPCINNLLLQGSVTLAFAYHDLHG